MTMTVGTASIAVDAAGVITVTGSGLAKAIADGMAASGGSVQSRVAAMLVSIPDPVLRATVLPGVGSFFEKIAHDCALGVVNHLSAHAVAVINVGQSPGRMPASPAPGTPLAPPLAAVELPIA